MQTVQHIVACQLINSGTWGERAEEGNELRLPELPP